MPTLSVDRRSAHPPRPLDPVLATVPGGPMLCVVPVRWSGELTARTSEALRRRVHDDPYPDAILDLTELTDLDQCGIGALLGAIRTVRARGGQAVIVAAPTYLDQLAAHGVGRLARLRLGCAPGA